jgi:hypothetical protein
MSYRKVPGSLALASLIIACALPAHAFERLFPAGTKRGVLSTDAYPALTLDGKPKRLSVGGWIRNQNNTVDMPASLRGQEFVVNYTENAQGEIDRAWILTEQEAKKPAPSGQPAQFGPAVMP